MTKKDQKNKLKTLLNKYNSLRSQQIKKYPVLKASASKLFLKDLNQTITEEDIKTLEKHIKKLEKPSYQKPVKTKGGYYLSKFDIDLYNDSVKKINQDKAETLELLWKTPIKDTGHSFLSMGGTTDYLYEPIRKKYYEYDSVKEFVKRQNKYLARSLEGSILDKQELYKRNFIESLLNGMPIYDLDEKGQIEYRKIINKIKRLSASDLVSKIMEVNDLSVYLSFNYTYEDALQRLEELTEMLGL